MLTLELPRSSDAGERLQVAIAYGGVPASGLQIAPNKHGDRTFFSDVIVTGIHVQSCSPLASDGDASP